MTLRSASSSKCWASISSRTPLPRPTTGGQSAGSSRHPGAATGLLLARADGQAQSAAAGNQAAGRVAFFLRTEDFDAAYGRLVAAGVEFITSPRTEPYGRVAVFRDIAGNKWDLLGPT